MVSDDPVGFIEACSLYSWTQVVNIKRDPIRNLGRPADQDAFRYGRLYRVRSTAYVYDWNILLIGQALWL